VPLLAIDQEATGGLSVESRSLPNRASHAAPRIYNWMVVSNYRRDRSATYVIDKTRRRRENSTSASPYSLPYNSLDRNVEFI
jgi:hypothetical protein